MFSLSVNAQEFPPILNYTPVEYGGANQNWSIEQAENGNIYVGNTSGLLEFNGSSWNVYPSKNNSITRSVKIVENRIFTGSYMDFGYWEKDDFGNLNYTSLVQKLSDSLLDDETFWNVLHIDSYVLFQSLKRIYAFNLSDNTFKIINSNAKRAIIFNLGGSIYFQKTNEGIFKIEDGEVVLVSDFEVFKNQVVVGAFIIDKAPVFLTEKGSFYLFDQEVTEEIKKYSNPEIQSKLIYSSIQLSNGSFVLGTISDGIYQIDKEGKLIAHINKENGLLNNTVLSVFEDRDNNVWLGLDNGISVVNFNSPFSEFNDTKGVVGQVYASKVFEDKLYIGTNQGLFFKENYSSSPLKLVKKTKGQVWSLREIDKTLFCGHNEGTFILKDGKATKISDIPGAWDFKKVPKSNRFIIQGNYDGLYVLEKKEGIWQFKNRVSGFNISSRFFEFISDNEILVNHEYKGVFKLLLSNDLNKIEEETKFDPLGTGSSLVKYNNRVLHASKSGIYLFSNNQFEKDSLLSNLLYDDKDPILGSLLSDDGGRLWAFSNENIVYLKNENFSNNPKVIKIPIEKSYRSSKLAETFENISQISEDNFLIGNTDGYSIIDLNKISNKPFEVSINSIFKQVLNNPKEQVKFLEKVILKPKERNLYFNFSVPEFTKNKEVYFQFKLEGYYDNWSEWKIKPDVSFENLPFGEYVFKVKAKVGNIESANIENFNFEIKKPWYVSNLAIAAYVLISLFLFLLIHFFYRRHYNKQKLSLVRRKQREFALSQLESEKIIMKLKNDKLKNEVESKTRELSASTMSIVKKNEILNTLKKELLNLNLDAQVKPVIKIINSNLSLNKDWEMFEEAFNNADTDFLKKIKEIHPNLTPNDLKLCAYLRLNLSSKEIAPLLNISPRSVEIKRYRLRKKIDLAHENSLVEYILNV